jgi:type I restriction enzyme M protein
VNPLTVKRNDYHENKKNSTVYTPVGVAQFLFATLQAPIRRQFDARKQLTVFDPAIGTGRLTDPWYAAGCNVVGCDATDQGARCQQFDHCRFEDFEPPFPPDLVLCNPPFNGAPKKQLYPEVFLKRIFELFGTKTPVVLFVPMGFLLNQRRKSKRWRWLRDCGAELTSIVSLPLDIFEDVEFHSEIVIFNVEQIKPHYFLPEEYL